MSMIWKNFVKKSHKCKLTVKLLLFNSHTDTKIQWKSYDFTSKLTLFAHLTTFAINLSFFQNKTWFISHFLQNLLSKLLHLNYNILLMPVAYLCIRYTKQTLAPNYTKKSDVKLVFHIGLVIKLLNCFL